MCFSSRLPMTCNTEIKCLAGARLNSLTPIYQINRSEMEGNITMKEQRMIVVLAHPDDESFPLGGTLAKYATEGAEVILVCATKGEAGIPGLPAEETAHLRERELRAAADILGLSDVRFLGW